jgi:hypothetical protein
MRQTETSFPSDLTAATRTSRGWNKQGSFSAEHFLQIIFIGFLSVCFNWIRPSSHSAIPVVECRLSFALSDGWSSPE